MLLVMSLLWQPYACGQNFEDHVGDDICTRAEWALDHVMSSTYRHNRKTAFEQISENLRTGELNASTDSAGFLSWVLFSVSPGHLFTIQGDSDQCPDSNAFAKFFSQIARRDTKDGWLNIPSALELERGDVIALGVSSAKQKGDEGRVMIVASPASEIHTARIGGQDYQYVSVRVIDSSPSPHFGEEKLPPLVADQRRNGLGEGTVRIYIDSHGKPTGILLGQTERLGSEPDTQIVLGMARPLGPPRLQEAPMEALDYEKQRAPKDPRRVAGR
jgi:hypothetical protein